MCGRTNECPDMKDNLEDPDGYYTAPSEEIFQEIKEKSIEIWGNYSDEFGYRSEKISRIEGINNIKDNAMYIVAMFDNINQEILVSRLSLEARLFVKNRIY
jgi:hypothetical protein